MLHSVVPPRILGIIPARFASSRFPGKALALLAEKPMVQHVYERAMMLRYLRRVIVATDDDRIARTVRGFGGDVRMMGAVHPLVTARVGVMASAENADLYVNIQGDEPLIDHEAIDAAVLSVLGDEHVSMGTLKKKIADPDEVSNPNVVKVITALNGDAIYFSRTALPYYREGIPGRASYYKHIGLYVYRRDFLLHYPDLSVGPLETAEC